MESPTQGINLSAMPKEPTRGSALCLLSFELVNCCIGRQYTADLQTWRLAFSLFGQVVTQLSSKAQEIHLKRYIWRNRVDQFGE